MTQRELKIIVVSTFVNLVIVFCCLVLALALVWAVNRQRPMPHGEYRDLAQVCETEEVM